MTGWIPSAHGIHDWIREGNMPPTAEKYLDGLICYTEIWFFTLVYYADRW